jgi:hypothetical protein
VESKGMDQTSHHLYPLLPHYNVGHSCRKRRSRFGPWCVHHSVLTVCCWTYLKHCFHCLWPCLKINKYSGTATEWAWNITTIKCLCVENHCIKQGFSSGTFIRTKDS